MATISRPLPIFIMYLEWVWLQSPDHYQIYAVSRMGMATISRPLPIFILCL
jgi:hypothetical protein